MLATSSRQPSSSNGGRQPALDDGLEPHERSELLGAMVELRQRPDARPRLVAVLEPLVEVEEPPLGRVGVAAGAREPRMRRRRRG